MEFEKRQEHKLLDELDQQHEMHQDEFQHHRMSRSSLLRPSVMSSEGGDNHHIQGQGHQRDRFNNYFEYLLSVLGFTAGFGSLWRFPYLVFKNGGGAFLIPYFILLVVIGIPCYYLETALGQLYQKGPPKIFEQFGKRFKGLGYIAVLIAFNEATYYNLILAYSIYYLWQSCQFPLPWKIDWEQNSGTPWNKEYFYDEVLQSTDSINQLGGIVMPIFYCYALSQIVVFLCVQKGVAVSGRIALFTATSPYVLLIILMLRGFFLDGAYDGLSYLFTPDMSKLTDMTVWTDAAAQILFQFSCGISVLVFFGSYRDPKSEVHKSAICIPLLTSFCGFLSAFAVFSYMGFMAKISGLTIEQLPLSGPDLTFIAYPAVLSMMPMENLWAIIFFSVMIFLGIDTYFGFMVGLAGCIVDEFGTPKGIKIGNNRYISLRVVRFILCMGVILTGLLYSTQAGFHYLGFVDFYTTAVPSLASVALETYFFTHYKDWRTLELKIRRYIKIPTPIFYQVLLKYVVPFLCAALALSSLYQQICMIGDQNFLVTLFGWFITLYPFIFALYIYNKYKESDKLEEEEKQKAEGNAQKYQEYI